MISEQLPVNIPLNTPLCSKGSLKQYVSCRPSTDVILTTVDTVSFVLLSRVISVLTY